MSVHIMEGFLPAEHAVGWAVASVPFVALGIRSIKKQVEKDPESKMVLGVATAFTFVLSALKLPSVTGSCSHPTGTGLGTIIFGPLAMAPVALVVLLFQALLLAHGGLTTLGANVFSMGIVGPFVGWGIWMLCRRIGLPRNWGVFFAAAFADLATYVATSAQLALAFPDPVAGFAGSFAKFMGVFALTQVPLAISEGLLTVLIFDYIRRYSAGLFARLGLATAEKGA